MQKLGFVHRKHIRRECLGFIVGDGATFPNCNQHQVANLAGALDGTAGGTLILWGAKFNGNDGDYDPDQYTYDQDNVQSYTPTESAIDRTAMSFRMWSWRMAGGVEKLR